jgi:hypothetical protein
LSFAFKKTFNSQTNSTPYSLDNTSRLSATLKAFGGRIFPVSVTLLNLNDFEHDPSIIRDIIQKLTANQNKSANNGECFGSKLTGSLSGI